MLVQQQVIAITCQVEYAERTCRIQLTVWTACRDCDAIFVEVAFVAWSHICQVQVYHLWLCISQGRLTEVHSLMHLHNKL